MLLQEIFEKIGILYKKIFSVTKNGVFIIVCAATV